MSFYDQMPQPGFGEYEPEIDEEKLLEIQKKEHAARTFRWVLVVLAFATLGVPLLFPFVLGALLGACIELKKARREIRQMFGYDR